jgi:hypothetical protein
MKGGVSTLKQKINPFVAVVVILAVVAGAGWSIYTTTQPHMIDLPSKSDAQRIAEGRQKAQAMGAALSAMAKGAKAKTTGPKANSTGQATGRPTDAGLPGHPAKPEQKSGQEN